MPLHVCLDRLGRSGRHLGRKRADFLCLGCQRTELLLPIGSLELHDLGEVLCPSRVFCQIKAAI
jgi:hypothetical protein